MNSWQQPNTAEPGGATWHKVENPGTGWFASKTAGWTADSFSGGLTVDFSSVVPVGTRAVVARLYNAVTSGDVFARKGGDSNISNTPSASSEVSHQEMVQGQHGPPSVFWLSATYTVDIAVTNTGQDIYVAYPREYLL